MYAKLALQIVGGMADKENNIGRLLLWVAVIPIVLPVVIPLLVIMIMLGGMGGTDQNQIDVAPDSYIGTNYGDRNLDGVVYFNQTDSRWGGLMYGQSGTIGQAGCGPTSMAMVVSSMTDTYITPEEMSQWSVDNGYRAEGNGSYHSLIPAAGIEAGLTVKAIRSDKEALIDALESGKLVVAIMGKGNFTSSGHFIVLRDITEDGKILVADSVSYPRSELQWDIDLIIDEAIHSAGAGGPFWTFAVDEIERDEMEEPI